MNPAYQVIRYIVENNDWKSIPKRVFQACIFQIYKRVSKKTKIKTLFNGAKLYLFRHSPIASAFVYTSVPDAEEIEALRALADKETIFLDIGANIGTYSLLMMDKVKAVYAFEAHPKTAQLCKENFILNNISPENVLTFAVSDDNQPKLFTDQPEGCPTNCRATQSEGLHVPAITLDEFIEQKKWDKHLTFLVKIDVEGFEHEVFSGAKTFLKDYAVKGIVFENFSSQHENIILMLNQLGYKTQAIGKNNTFVTQVCR